MHNHPPRCCCTTTGAPILAPHRCPSCPDHGHLATLTKTREEIAAGLANYATRPAPTAGEARPCGQEDPHEPHVWVHKHSPIICNGE